MENYSKIKLLGNGSNGNRVYLVKEINTNATYAMKIMTVTGDTSRVLNELRILSSLKHDNIIQYIDSFKDEDRICLIMECADKGDLNQYVKAHKENKTKIPEEDIWKWYTQTLSALRLIHSKNIIHRDIKVHNAFLTNEGNIKLGDFGIAKLMENSIDFTNTTLGTPYYLSPEICYGEKYNNKADVWMFGCLLYELCSLSKPFIGDSIPGILNNIKHSVPPAISNFYSNELISLISIMMDKNPDTRPGVEDLALLKLEYPIKLPSNNKAIKQICSFNSKNFDKKLKIHIKDNNTEKKETQNISRCGSMHQIIRKDMPTYKQVSTLL